MLLSEIVVSQLSITQAIDSSTRHAIINEVTGILSYQLLVP